MDKGREGAENWQKYTDIIYGFPLKVSQDFKEVWEL